MSQLEELLAFQIAAVKLPEPTREHRFHPHRRWRFDFAWPDLMIAVEVEGGAWINGRHTRPAGFRNDLDKYNSAMSLGWTIYRCDSKLIETGEALETIEALHRMRLEVIRNAPPADGPSATDKPSSAPTRRRRKS